MLIKVTTPLTTPLKLARQVTQGGLLYSRVSRANRLQELTQGAEYSRKVKEWLPRRSNPDWKTPRAQRISYSAGRTVCLHRPPAHQTSTSRLPVRAYPEGWGLPFDGLETSAYWEKRFHRTNPPGGPEGVPYLEVCHRGRVHFEEWAARRARAASFISAGWGHRPRKEQDPLRGVYDYLHRGGSSPLRGVRFSVFPDRGAHLQHRLSRLYRRHREHHLLDLSLEDLSLYRGSSRRKKRPPSEARFLLFRRRRLRNYLTGLVSHRNYIGRLTRRGFYRWHPNRWARLEKASLLGGTYVEARSTWGVRLLGARVGTPLEYHLYSPFGGYGRLVKRRREGSRRLKLGQHTLWGPPFLAARAARWSWFKETPLGALVSNLPSREPSPQGAPTRGDLRGSLYWSSRTWGRSRWERPVGRQVGGFISSLKGGSTVEVDSHQWGRAGTSGVGIFLSLVGELELRSTWTPTWFTSPVGEARRSNWRGWVFNRLRWGAWLAGVGVWFVVTPVWWVYSKIAQGLCYTTWWLRRAFFWGQSLLLWGGEFMSHFVWRSFVVPGQDYLTHWVKDTSFFKTVGWVWTSWNLVYSSDEDQRKLDLTAAEPLEDQAQEYFLDEVEPTEENIPDEEEEIDVHGGVPRFPHRESWLTDLDEEYKLGWDHLLEFVGEEIPYRVGFFLQPLIDVGLRLPLWGLLEGVSLFALVVKLEYQRGWTKLLRLGGGPQRGRWWKIPLLLVRWTLQVGGWLFLIWWAGSTLSYSTLRLEVVLWGWPWREEYYLFWWGLITFLATKLVGPPGVKDFLVHQVGGSNLVGLFWGAAEAASPEEYYPGRPISMATPALREAVGINMRRHKTYDDVLTHLREVDLYVGGSINAGYDEIELILAQKYEYADSFNWDEADEANYFNQVLHLEHSQEIETNSPYGPNGLGLRYNEHRSRGSREPHYLRNNYYELTYEGILGRKWSYVYNDFGYTNGGPAMDENMDDSSELFQWSRDETQIEISNDK